MTTAPTDSVITETADAVGIRSSALFGLRPLKWEKTESSYYQTYRAQVPMGSYTVERHREGWEDSKPWEPWVMKYHFVEYYDEGEDQCASLNEGKEMAWKDWQKRIMPALILIKPNDKLTHGGPTNEYGCDFGIEEPANDKAVPTEGGEK